MLYFCLPVGLLTLGLWIWLVREPIHHLLAMPSSMLSTSVRWWCLAGVAIALGAATHVFWDGFTHGFGWATRVAPILRQRIWVGGIGIPAFNMLQHLSTAVGGLVVLSWLVHAVRMGEPRALLMRWRVAVFASIAAVTAVVAVWNGLRQGAISDYWTLKVAVVRAAVGGLLGLGMGLVGYAMVHRLLAPRWNRDHDHAPHVQGGPATAPPPPRSS